MKKLRELADVRMGYPFRSRLEHDPHGDVAVIQMKDIDDANCLRVESAMRVSLPEGKAHHLIHKGDLVFRSRGRSNLAALIASNIGEAVVAAPMLLVRPRAVLPAYLHWFINLPATQVALAAVAKGTSVRMISKDALLEMDVPVPEMKQQLKIADVAALSLREQVLMADIVAERRWLTDRVLMQYAKNSR
jgi:hypothetical protein